MTAPNPSSSTVKDESSLVKALSQAGSTRILLPQSDTSDTLCPPHRKSSHMSSNNEARTSLSSETVHETGFPNKSSTSSDNGMSATSDTNTVSYQSNNGTNLCSNKEENSASSTCYSKTSFANRKCWSTRFGDFSFDGRILVMVLVCFLSLPQ